MIQTIIETTEVLKLLQEIRHLKILIVKILEKIDLKEQSKKHLILMKIEDPKPTVLIHEEKTHQMKVEETEV